MKWTKYYFWSRAGRTVAAAVLCAVMLTAGARAESSAAADAPPAAAAEEKMTELMRAARYGDAETVKKLLSQGADIGEKDKDGTTLLMYAAHSNRNPEVIKALLAAGTDVNAKDDGGHTPLMYAALNKKQPEIINVLLAAAGVDVNAKDNTGWTALHFALGNNIPSRGIKMLIDAKADVNAKDNNGLTPLMAAAHVDQDPEVIKVLLAAGADLSARSEAGKTALDYATDDMVRTWHAKSDDSIPRLPEVVRTLANAEAAKVLKEAKDDLPIFDAVLAALYDSEYFSKSLRNNIWKKVADERSSSRNLWDQNRNIVSSLFVLGEQLRIVLKSKENKIYDALSKNQLAKWGMKILEKNYLERERPDVLLLVRKDENFFDLCRSGSASEVKAALEAGADVKAKDAGGATPLMRAAATNNDPEVIKMLLDAGADVNAKDKGNWTALMMAAATNKSPEVIKSLLAVGADVNAKDKSGETPLMKAILESNSPEVIKILLDAKADVNAKDADGTTVLSKAMHREPEVIKMILEAGADVSAKDDIGETPLISFVISNVLGNALGNVLAPKDIAEIIGLLPKTDVDAKTRSGMTALMFAARDGNDPGLVEALLDAGADISVSTNGKTALDLALANEALGRASGTLRRLGATEAQIREANPATNTDYVSGYRLFEKLALDGNVTAMAVVGACCMEGYGTERDRAEGLKWLNRAADSGDTGAMCRLAAAYENGEGVDKSEEEAKKWYEKAAKLGNAVAKDKLNSLEDDAER